MSKPNKRVTGRPSAMTGAERAKLEHYERIMTNVAEMRADEEASKAIERAQTRGVHLSQRDKEQLARQFIDFNSKFAAIRRLSWEMGGSDMDLDAAAAEGIEALCIVGGLESDAMCRVLGEPGGGHFREVLEKLNRSVRKSTGAKAKSTEPVPASD